MTDNAELKRLAEAFPADLDWDSNTEPFFNGPSGESLGGGSTGFYCVYGAPFEIDGEQYDGHTYVETCKADFAKFVVAARDGVLALIAENDRLVPFEEAYATACNVRNRLIKENELLDRLVVTNKALSDSFRAERDQLKAENDALKGPHDWLAEDLIKELVDNAQAIQENADDGEEDRFVIVLLASASRIRRQEANIDQLRAEVAGLKAGYEAYERVNAELKAEVERLDKLLIDASGTLRKASSWICREVEAETKSATHWAIRRRETADQIDTSLGQGEQS